MRLAPGSLICKQNMYINIYNVNISYWHRSAGTLLFLQAGMQVYGLSLCEEAWHICSLQLCYGGLCPAQVGMAVYAMYNQLKRLFLHRLACCKLAFERSARLQA